MKAIVVALSILSASVAPTAQQTVVPPPPPTPSLTASFQRSYALIKGFLTDQAQVMPEAEYAFRPTADVRSFGQLVGHIADYNFIYCARAMGAVNPYEGRSFETRTTKADLSAALAESFAYCDPAFAALTDASATELVQQNGTPYSRAGSLLLALTHDYEEYGYGAVYLRLRGVLPPSSQRTQP